MDFLTFLSALLVFTHLKKKEQITAHLEVCHFQSIYDFNDYIL